MPVDGPLPGDRILICQPRWLRLLLSGEKTLECRATNFKTGRYLLGSQGVVHAVAHLGGTIAVEHEKDWVRLRRFHKMQDRSPPWRPFTYAFHVSILKRVRVPFRHPRGALSIVVYRP